MGFKEQPWGIGTRQSRGGAIIWHSRILVLERAYKKDTGQGVEYYNPESLRRFFQWLVRFVDGKSI